MKKDLEVPGQKDPNKISLSNRLRLMLYEKMKPRLSEVNTWGQQEKTKEWNDSNRS